MNLWTESRLHYGPERGKLQKHLLWLPNLPEKSPYNIAEPSDSAEPAIGTDFRAKTKYRNVKVLTAKQKTKTRSLVFSSCFPEA